MQLVLNLAAHLIAGLLLMLVAHFGAFLGTGHGLPYWWAYLVLYPVAAIVSVKSLYLRPFLSSASLCMAPAMYFIALGLTSHKWNGDTLAGAALAFILSLVLSSLAGRSKTSVQTAD